MATKTTQLYAQWLATLALSVAATTSCSQRVPAGLLQRGQLLASVSGRTADAVEASLGRPDVEQQVGKVRYWYYFERTIDPETGRPDDQVQLAFRDGHVTSVLF